MKGTNKPVKNRENDPNTSDLRCDRGQKVNLRNSFFLFSNLSKERVKWLCSTIKASNSLETINLYLTGNSLYSLLKPSIQQSFLTVPQNFNLFAHEKEASLTGISKHIENNYPKALEPKNSTLHFNFTDGGSQISFWKHLIESIHQSTLSNLKDFSFLQLEGPYMARSSVYATNFVRASLESGHKTYLFNYLDGIHLGHAYQSPSEFLNIGESLENLTGAEKQQGKNLQILACSRCATARGYFNSKTNEGRPGVIEDFRMVNLNKIVDKLESNSVCLGANSGLFYATPDKLKGEGVSSQPVVENVLFVTRPPYDSEYAFGAISMGMASASHQIPTKVVFIEDGIYCAVGNHKVTAKDKIFNVQEAIEATGDMENLDYFVFSPSLEKRHAPKSEYLTECKPIEEKILADIMFNLQQDTPIHRRIIFF